MRTITLGLLLSVLAVPALGQTHPVQGRWGQSTNSEEGAIDCVGKRVIDFIGNQRTDSNGGVPSYRNRSVTAEGPSSYRIVDEFTAGQISAGHTFTFCVNWIPTISNWSWKAAS
ncbi:MAG TPA: hypothetical protein VGJ76_04630 [Pseudolabrys sp.]|jgi:hypothetical protein